jgi:H+/gluconate symporter-like permease
MNLVWLSYLYDILQGVNLFLGLILSIAIACLVMSPLLADYLAEKKTKVYESYEKRAKLEKEYTKKIIIKSFISALISLVLLSLMPSERTFYIYIGEKLASQKDVNMILNKTYKLILKKLDNQLKENE